MSTLIDTARSQFPALHQRGGATGQFRIFLDNPAGTQVPKGVIAAYSEYFQSMNANSGGHFRTSRATDQRVAEVRALVADYLHAFSPEEIVIGPNMTTLNFALSHALASRFAPGDEIIVTRMDHDANISPWLHLAQDRDLTIRWIDIDTESFTLDLSTFEEALTSRTRLVAVGHASNAIGTINPVGAIAERAHAAGALVVVDAVQSTPHIPIDVRLLGCDFLLCSAYKFFGPHLGIMWGRKDLLESLPVYKVRPASNHTPGRWETGTPSFESIHALGATMEYFLWVAGELGDIRLPRPYDGRPASFKKAMVAIESYERRLTAHLLEGLAAQKAVRVYGITDEARLGDRVPTVAFAHDRLSPSDIAARLGEQEIYVWDGHYYAIEVMRRLGRADQGLLRVGLAHYNTMDEIDRFLEALVSL
jgi:cysteine desulfurase family protein (TIGR01976 family)